MAKNKLAKAHFSQCGAGNLNLRSFSL